MKTVIPVQKKYDRRNNPRGLVKPMEEHIEHFKKRLLQRFNIKITIDEYHTLLANIRHAKHIYHLNSQTGVYSIMINGVEVWVLYGSASDRIEARLKTAILPYEGLLVPDEFADDYTHEEFTAKVNEVVEYFKEVSKELDLNNKKEFFMRTDIPQFVKSAACKFKEHPETTKLTMVSMAIKYLTSEV
jgi:thiaminase